MARRGRRRGGGRGSQIGADIDDINAPDNALSYTITDFSYQGELWVNAEWTWHEDIKKAWVEGDAKQAEVGLQKASSCGAWDGSGPFDKLLYEDITGTAKKFEDSIYQTWKAGDEEPTICFQVYVSVPNRSNEHEIQAGTLKVTTYSDDKAQNEIGGQDGSTKEYDIFLNPAKAFYIPFYSCEPRDVIAQVGTDKKGNPVYSKPDSQYSDCNDSGSISTKAIWMKVDPDEDLSTAIYPTSAEGGTICAMNLSDDVSGVKIKEYYLSGEHTTTKPSQWIDFKNGSGYTSPGGRFANKVKKISETTDEGMLKPGAAGIKIVSGSGCETCRKKYELQALWLIESHMETLARFGFRTAFTGLALSEPVLKHADNPDGEIESGSEDIVWTKSVSAAFQSKEAFSIPNGMGTRINLQQGFEWSPSWDPDKPYELYTRTNQFWAHIESTMSQQYKFHRLIKGTLRRDMNLPHDAYFEEQSNGEVWVYDSEGNRIKDTQSLTVEDVEIFIEKVMSTATSGVIGFSKSDLFRCELNYSVSTTTSETESGVTKSISQDENWSAVFNCSFAGFKSWVYQAPHSVAVDADYDTWKSGVFNLSVDMGSGGTSKGADWVNDTTIDEDGNIEISRNSGHPNTSYSKYGDDGVQIKSITMDYTVELPNGWNFDVGDISLTEKDGKYDLTDPENFTYTLRGKIADDWRWCLEKSSGGVKLAVGGSLDLVKRFLDNKGKGFVGPSGVLRKSTMNIGLICDNHAAGNLTFSPKASINSNILGFEHSLNLIDGSEYVKKSYSRNFKDEWNDFLDGEDDDFGVNFYIRGDRAIDSDGNFSGVWLTAGADATLEKTLIEFGEVAGSLHLTAKLKADYGPDPSTAGSIFGWQATATVTWKNNVLEWFGFPFNIHPGLTAYGVGAFTFGGYLPPDDGTNGGQNENDASQLPVGVEYKKGATMRIGLGTVTWSIELADTFRQHLRRKHNSVFSFLGLGNCPILNKLGEKESIWAYLIRVAPINSVAAIGEAAQICADRRKVYFEDNYNILKNRNRLMPAVYRALHPANPYNNRYGCPICGELDLPASYSKPVSSWDNTKEEVVENLWQTENRYPSTNLYPKWYNQLANDAAIPPTTPYKDMDYKEGNPHSPFPCMLTNFQLVKAANVITLAYDKSNSRCKCISDEFYKITYTKYRDNYDFGKWDDELSGMTDPTHGFATRGLDKMDEIILRFVLRSNIDPVKNTKLKDLPRPKDGNGDPVPFNQTRYEFPLATLRSTDPNSPYKCLENDTCKECYNKIIREELTNIAKDVGIFYPNDPDYDSEAIAEINKWTKKRSWWTETGICGGIGDILKKAVGVFFSVIKNIPLVGRFFGGAAENSNPVVDALYDKINPCTIPSGSGGTGSGESDECYDKFVFWQYYLKVYGPVADFLASTESESTDPLFSYIRDKYVDYSTGQIRGGKIWRNWFNGNLAMPYNPNNASDFVVKSKLTVPLLSDAGNLQKDLLKTYLIHKGIHPTWLTDGIFTKVGDIGGSGFDFTKPMNQASDADAKKLDQANGFSQTYTTPKSHQFCHELYGYMYPPGGNNLRAESDLQLTDPPCTTKAGWIEDHKTDIVNYKPLDEADLTDNIFEDDDVNEDDEGIPESYRGFLDANTTVGAITSAAHRSAKNQALSLDVGGVNSGNPTPHGLGKDRLVILNNIIRELLSDPVLAVNDSASQTRVMYDSDANANLIREAFSNVMTALQDGNLTDLNAAGKSKRHDLGVRIYELEDLLFSGGSPSTADPLISNIISSSKKNLAAIKTFFKSICLEVICREGLPIKLLSYIDTGTRQGRTFGFGGSVVLSYNLNQYTFLLYTTLFGAFTTGSNRLPTFKSLRGSADIRWNYNQYGSDTDVHNDWNPEVMAYSDQILRFIQGQDDYVSSFATTFAPKDIFTNGVANAANASTNRDKADSVYTLMKAAGKGSTGFTNRTTTNAGTVRQSYLPIGGANHWPIICALYHAKSNAWTTGTDANKQRRLYNCLTNASGTSRMSTDETSAYYMNPFYMDHSAEFVRSKNGNSTTVSISELWDGVMFRNNMDFHAAHNKVYVNENGLYRFKKSARINSSGTEVIRTEKLMIAGIGRSLSADFENEAQLNSIVQNTSHLPIPSTRSILMIATWPNSPPD